MSDVRPRSRTAKQAALIRELYVSDTPRAQTFRYGLLIFDAATILFLIISSFYPRTAITEILDVLIGLIILGDFMARMAISRRRLDVLFHPLGIADLIVILSFLAPIAGEGFAFLRVLRTLRLLRSYQFATRLRRNFTFFRTNYDVVVALLHLFVFLFVMTALVYETQRWRNPDISNYADALYFTVTTLTTTGFGDITLPGTTGRLLSVLIMLFGVGLFIRLVQVLFRPKKVRYECPRCGLLRHDPDAVHCKHCGHLIHIQTEGA